MVGVYGFAQWRCEVSARWGFLAQYGGDFGGPNRLWLSSLYRRAGQNNIGKLMGPAISSELQAVFYDIVVILFPTVITKNPCD